MQHGNPGRHGDQPFHCRMGLEPGYHAWIETLNNPRRADDTHPAQIAQQRFCGICIHGKGKDDEDDRQYHHAHPADQ